MATSRTTLPRRTSRITRGAVVAALAGAGIALGPLPASAAPPAAAVAAAPAPTPAAQIAIDTALAQVGKPYAWGGAGPHGFDCSGLTQFAYGAAGIHLPHSSRMQSTMGTPVDLWHLQPGDLVFYYSPVSHVGIYLGDGMMAHSSTYGQPVSVVWMGHMPGFVGGARIA